MNGLRFPIRFAPFSCGRKFVEIRAFTNADGVVSGVFSADASGEEALTHELDRLQLWGVTIYQVLNVLAEGYISGVTKLNVLTTHTKRTASARDIHRLMFLMTDFDPVRPSKTASTDEHDKTCAEQQHLLKSFHNICHRMNSDYLVEFDRSVTNPSRLCKLPGTWAVKGDNTLDHPHRQSAVVYTRKTPKQIPLERFQAFVDAHSDLLAPQPRTAEKTSNPEAVTSSATGRRHTAFLPDVESYIRSQGWRFFEKDGEKGHIFVLPVCPFNAAHDNAAAFMVSYPDGHAFFRCHHNGCMEQGNDIHKLVQYYPPKAEIYKEI